MITDMTNHGEEYEYVIVNLNTRIVITDYLKLQDKEKEKSRRRMMMTKKKTSSKKKPSTYRHVWQTNGDALSFSKHFCCCCCCCLLSFDDRTRNELKYNI